MKSSSKIPLRDSQKDRRRGISLSVLAILDPTHPGPYDFRKDSSHLLLLALQRRGHTIDTCDPSSLLFKGDRLKVQRREVLVLEKEPFFAFSVEKTRPATEFPLILMRKDPPVDSGYLYATELLSLVSKRVSVINHPQALRDWNEKLAILNFPRWIPPTLVAADKGEIDLFIRGSPEGVVIKPLEGFAGRGVKRLQREDPNYLTTLDDRILGGTRLVMVQKYLPEVERGEKRVFMIDGRPLGALLKIPPEGGFITNPEWGGRVAATTLTTRERRLCAEIGPFLKKNRIFFAGVDLIGERLIEINITSPGLLWEWNEVDNRRHEEEIVDLLEKQLRSSRESGL